MNKYVIDGLFLTQQTTGIHRVAFELISELDKIVEPDELEILVPESFTKDLSFNNIKVIKYGKKNGIPWEQVDYASYARKNKKECLCFTNVVPLTYKHGIVMVHDVSYKVNPQYFTSKRDRLSAIWHRINYKAIANSSMKILTVSNFSKGEIERVYHVDKKRISVVYNAWQHMDKIMEAADVFDRYSMLKDKEYYFSMATLAANKNFKWILYAAKNNPDKEFAIAGGGKLKGAAEAEGFTNLPNVHFLGYVSDEDAKALMHHCKAFLFPTFYEGFGLPPLEAVACGCKRIIVSDTPCMHEVYGDYVEYIDPYNYENIKIEDTNKEVSKELLDKYSWKKSAKQLKNFL